MPSSETEAARRLWRRTGAFLCAMLVVLAALTIGFAGGAVAQALPGAPAANAGAETPVAAVDPAEIDRVVATLKDEEARARLIAALELMARAQRGVAPAEPPGEGARAMEALSESIQALSASLARGAAYLVNAPKLVEWLRAQWSGPASRDLWLTILWQLAVVLAAGLIVEFALNRVVARPRRGIESRLVSRWWSRLIALIGRAIIDLVPIAAFAAAAYVALTALDPGRIARLIVLSLVNASVIARFIVVIGRAFLAPAAPQLRLVPITDETSHYLFIWLRRITAVVVYGYFLAEAALLLGMPRGGYAVVMGIIGFIVAVFAIVIVLQNRRPVADWLRRDGSSGAIGVVRARLADVWHVLALVYIVALFVVWIMRIGGGFAYLFEATLLTVVILVVAQLVSAGALRAISRGFAVSEELRTRFPGLEARANRYIPTLKTAVKAFIWVIAIFAVMAAWGLQSFAWLDSDFGRRFASSAFTIIAILVGGVLLWEITNSLIERKLRAATQGEGLGPRARTILPLARNALMVVLATIVIMLVLAELGVNIGPLLAGAGVVGLAVGFGAQTLVKDVITGVFILLEDQISVGDVVQVGSHAGLVEGMTIRTLRLRDLAGNVHAVPFGEVTTVQNMTKDYSRYVFDIGVAYREDTDEVVRVLMDIAEGLQSDPNYAKDIVEPFEVLGVDSFGDSAVVIKARITTRPIQQWRIGREFNRRMKKRFDELGIEIPFPHRTLYFGVAKDGTAPPASVVVSDRNPQIEGEAREQLRPQREPDPTQAGERP